MDFAWFDVVGMLGTAIIIGTYLLLQLERLEGAGLVYSALNAVGAGMILVSLAHEFNMAAFVVEAFWALISVLGIARNLAGRARGAAA